MSGVKNVNKNTENPFKILTFRTKCMGCRYFVAKAAIICQFFLKTQRKGFKKITQVDIVYVYTTIERVSIHAVKM